MRSEWWRPMAIHLWRSYFHLTGTDPSGWKPQDKTVVRIVQPVYDGLSQLDQQISREFFSCRWGEGSAAIQKIHEDTLVPAEAVQMIVRKAEKQVVRAMNLM